MTIEAIERAVAAFTSQSDAYWERAAVTMRAQGFDPNKGATLVLPTQWERQVMHPVPPWVVFTPLVNEPAMLQTEQAGIARALSASRLYPAGTFHVEQGRFDAATW
ncbi:MAG: hypothetical protein LCH79_16335 [Proteobacteria bacterium]|nr:hypothetical protein [Pseudomonadota bacterium]